MGGAWPPNEEELVRPLGKQKSVHELARRSLVSSIIGGVVCLLGAIGSFVGAVLAAYSESHRRHGDPVSAFGGPAVLGALLLTVAALCFWSLFRYWGAKVVLYEGGFAYHGRQGLRAIAWGDVTGVWQSITRRYMNGVYVGTIYRYTVQTRDGAKYVMQQNLQNIAAFGEALTRAVAVTLLPGYKAALARGERLTFGKVAIDRRAITLANKTFPWSELKSVRVHRGNLTIPREGSKWRMLAGAPVASIPNFHALVVLLSGLTKVE